MAVCALEEKERLEEELARAAETARAEAETRAAATSTRERELEKTLEDLSERLARAEVGMRAAGSETPAPTPGRSPSGASFAKKLAIAEALAEGRLRARHGQQGRAAERFELVELQLLKPVVVALCGLLLRRLLPGIPAEGEQERVERHCC